jgi:hypothetical protein
VGLEILSQLSRCAENAKCYHDVPTIGISVERLTEVIMKPFNYRKYFCVDVFLSRRNVIIEFTLKTEVAQ